MSAGLGIAESLHTLLQLFSPRPCHPRCNPPRGGAMIRTNIGGLDTAIRAALGSFAIVLAAAGADQYPVVALATGLVATVILATAIAGVCPLYTALGLDTHPRGQPPRKTTRELAHQLR